MKSASQHGVVLQSASDRRSVHISLGTLALAAAWMVLTLLVQHFIRNGYRGQSFAFFNHMFTGQARYSMDDYLGRWNVFRWSGLGVILSAGAFLVVAGRSRPCWLVRLGPPVCAFLLARALLWVSFVVPAHYIGVNASPGPYRIDGSPSKFVTRFNLESWSRWDSNVYRSIARAGYEFYPCDIPRDGTPIARQGRWCGNCPWFPGYPALIWLTTRFKVGELAGAVLVSAIFCLLSLLVLWIELLGAERTCKNFLCLLFASLFPGSVFYHAVFPMSMATFFVLLSLYFARREQWTRCGIAALLSSFTYPSGAFLAAVFAIWFFYSFKSLPWRDKLWRTMTIGAGTSIGVAWVFIVQRLFVGAWFTFLTAQAGYKTPFKGHSGRDVILIFHPVMILVQSAKDVTHWVCAFTGLSRITNPVIVTPKQLIVSASILFVAATVVLLLAFSVRTARHSPLEAYQAIFLLVFWLALLSLDNWSGQTRKQGLLLPAVALARNLPTWILAAIVIVAFLFELLLGALFEKALVA